MASGNATVPSSVTNGTASEVLINALSNAKTILDSNIMEFGTMNLYDGAFSQDAKKKKKQQIQGLLRLLKELQGIIAVDFVE